jgi:hypothetical protein
MDAHRKAGTTVKGASGSHSYPHNLSQANKAKFGIDPTKNVKVFPVVRGEKAFNGASDPGRVRLARSASGGTNMLIAHPPSAPGKVDNSYVRMKEAPTYEEDWYNYEYEEPQYQDYDQAQYEDYEQPQYEDYEQPQYEDYEDYY